jgi:hypothetical protein
MSREIGALSPEMALIMGKAGSACRGRSNRLARPTLDSRRESDR